MRQALRESLELQHHWTAPHKLGFKDDSVETGHMNSTPQKAKRFVHHTLRSLLLVAPLSYDGTCLSSVEIRYTKLHLANTFITIEM
jgi:hypothetical protein